MKADIYLFFPGTCDQAFAFYEKVFNAKRHMTMKYGDMPPGAGSEAKHNEADNDLVMHTSMPVAGMTLMASDMPSNRREAQGGFSISLSLPDEAEVKRLFAELSEGGFVMIAPTPTFWSPLYSMFKDKFGVGWMISVPGEPANS